MDQPGSRLRGAGVGRADGARDARREMTRELDRRASAIRDRFSDGYTCFHSPRYAHVLRVVDEHAGPCDRVLDIGPSTLTALLAESLARPVDTLGWEDVAANGTGGVHHPFDLNSLLDGDEPTGLGTYGLIVFCEVLEHLYIAPEHVLEFVRRHLAPGGRLVLQTPNAAALDRRVKLVRGRHPYDALDPDRSGQRHVREYTADELRRFVEHAGLEIEAITCHAYFDHRWANGEDRRRPRLKRRVQNALDRIAPASLKPGITVVAKRAR